MQALFQTSGVRKRRSGNDRHLVGGDHNHEALKNFINHKRLQGDLVEISVGGDRGNVFPDSSVDFVIQFLKS